MQRREVQYRGQVQGVGFRYTCQQIAARHAVTGFVRNLPDGGVQLVVEGDAAELDAFLAEVRRAMHDYISHVDGALREGTGEFSGFAVRH